MTRPAPDWFGPGDPEMQREFLNEINDVHRELRDRKLQAGVDLSILKHYRRIPIRPSFTTGELTPKLPPDVEWPRNLRWPGLEP